jgi:hypothetical protein
MPVNSIFLNFIKHLSFEIDPQMIATVSQVFLASLRIVRIEPVSTLIAFLFLAWAFGPEASDSAFPVPPFRYLLFVTSLYLCFRGFSDQRVLCCLAAWLIGSQRRLCNYPDHLLLPEAFILLAFSCPSQIGFQLPEDPPLFPVIVSGLGVIAGLVFPLFNTSIPWSFVPLVLYAITLIKYRIARQDCTEGTKWVRFLVSLFPLALLVHLLAEVVYRVLYVTDVYSWPLSMEPGVTKHDHLEMVVSGWVDAPFTRNVLCCALFVSFWEPRGPGLDLLMLSLVTHLLLTWPVLYRLEYGYGQYALHRAVEYRLLMTVIACAQIVRARPEVALAALWGELRRLWATRPGKIIASVEQS